MNLNINWVWPVLADNDKLNIDTLIAGTYYVGGNMVSISWEDIEDYKKLMGVLDV